MENHGDKDLITENYINMKTVNLWVDPIQDKLTYYLYWRNIHKTHNIPLYPHYTLRYE